MTSIKSIGILSAGKVMGAVYALLGLIIGGFMTLISLAGFAAAGGGQEGAGALIFGVGAIILFPLFYGIAGFIAGLLTALIYNVVASLIGGIEVEFNRAGFERID